MTEHTPASVSWSQGSWIEFRLRDVCHPRPDELLQGACGDVVLEGMVVAVSRGEDADTTFVELELRGSHEHVIVRPPSPPARHHQAPHEESK